MSETELERAESFFKSKERCRQEYEEAWYLGRAVWDALVRERGLLDASEKAREKTERERDFAQYSASRERMERGVVEGERGTLRAEIESLKVKMAMMLRTAPESVSRVVVLEAELATVRDALRMAVEWIEHGLPTPPKHLCGPEQNCDGECVDWAGFAKSFEEWRSLSATKKEAR